MLVGICVCARLYAVAAHARVIRISTKGCTALPHPQIILHYLKYGIKAAMLICMDSNLVVRALSALAHESRLAIFRLLVITGPDGMPAGELAQQLGLAPSSLSFHLKDLSHAELVR